MVSPSIAILRVQSDERLVALARAGHERAFEAIVERYRRPLLRHARRLVGEARAEDAVQQALVAAWAALERGDDVRELSAWLHRIVHNTGLNLLRAQRDSVELRDSLAAGAPPHEVLERRLTVRETLEALAALPERQREALLRTAVEGRSQAEVAQALGLSDGAVRQLVHRARTAMRAAATALTPLPAASWLASAGARSEPIAGRVAELVAPAGAGATLAKAGTIAVLAGGAATGPALVERHEQPAPARAEARAERADRPAERAAPLGPASAPPAGPSRPWGSGSSGPSGSGSSGSGSSGSGSAPSTSGSSGSGGSGSSGSSGSGSSGSDSDSSGSDSSGSDTSGSGSSSGASGSDSSGSGSSSGSSGSGSSGSDSDSSGSGSSSGSSGSGSSGSGSEPTTYLTTTAEPTEDSSGSDTSGSGSSSGSSGSDSSGSGSG